jgi:hypothetical protein
VNSRGRIRLVIVAALVAAGISACGSDDETADQGAPLGGGVGSRCTSDEQCVGYDTPACLDAIRPLEDKITVPEHPAAEDYRNMTLPLPGGYCTTTIENACATDAECGEGGGCFLAFEGVPDSTIEALDSLDPPLPFSVRQFADAGICLKACTTDADCRASEGYTCMLPIDELMPLFNPDYTKKFCVKDEDYSHLAS